MVIFGVDDRIKAAFKKRLAQINDETLNKLFDKNTDHSYRFDPTVCRIFSAKPKEMKALFRKNFAEFKAFYDNHAPVHAAFSVAILSEMAFIEFADIDFKKWKFLDDYFTPDKKGYIVRDVTPYMVALRHKDADEIIDKIKRYPAATKVLFPALMRIRSKKAYEFFVEYIKSAGLEDSLRYSVFDCFLADRDLATLDFFTNAAIYNMFSRYKSLKEAMTHTDLEYALKFTVDERLKILRAVVDDNYSKYLDTKNGTHRLLVLEALIKYRRNEFSKLADKIMKSGDELMRKSLLYAIVSHRYDDTQFLPVIDGYDLTLPEFAAYMCGFNYTSLDRYLLDLGEKFGRALFKILLRGFDRMEKVNYNYSATDEFPVHSSVARGDVARHMIEIASCLNDDKMLRELESRYDSLTTEGQARFLATFAKKTKLDVRTNAIEFLRSDNVAGVNAYDAIDIKLTYAEAVRASEFLKSKKQAVKSKILKEYLRSPDKDRIANYLIGCKEPFKREIGEEMKGTADKLDAKKLEKVKPSHISRYMSSDTATVITLERPKVKFAGYPKRAVPQIEGKRIKALYAAIEKFIEENKDYEYTSAYGSTKLTIGATYVQTKFGCKLDCYPLWEKVKAIYDELAAFEALDLYTLSCVSDGDKKYAAFHAKGDGQKTFEAMRNKTNITVMYLQQLLALYVSDYVDPECAAEYLYQMYLFGLLEPKKELERRTWSSDELSTADREFPAIVKRAMQAQTDDSVKKLLELADGKLIDIDSSHGCGLIAKAYENGLASPEYLEYMLVKSPQIASCLTHRTQKNDLYLYSANFKYPEFREFYKTVIEHCVNAELKRGTLKTPYTPFVLRLYEMYGTDIFAKAIVQMRGLTLVRNNNGYWFDDKKNDVFSKILKTVRPNADETFDDFKRIIDEYGVTRDELIRAAVYNLDFLNFADKYLGIDGFKSAVLYFAAHLNEELSEERIEKIKEYSTIDYHDFKDGAIDLEWYGDMINTIPPAEFKRVYDNAKYITVAGLHKRAQRFFEALNGKIGIDEAKAQVLKSRNKDFCLIYSLIPITSEADLFERYTFLSVFLKESKQFGSQRQLSERRTVDIAFDNLARNAGYADSSVFIYEMESKDRRVIDMYDGIAAGDYSLKLVVDGEKVKLVVTDKNGKKLSAVPGAISKSPEVVEIAAYKKTEEEKRKRLKRSLENAMENEIEFSRAQILTITEQPLIRNFFERLILTDGKSAVVIRGDKFTDVSTGAENTSDKYKLAHPVALKEQGTLRNAMKFIIAGDIKQPFKQVFREIYLMSDGEREAIEVFRYKGFNVDLKKAVAALKTRGWGVSEDIGLRKVYYRNNTVSAIFREFDYYYIYDFADENRELESIMFFDRRDSHVMNVKDVSHIVFSETLRDVDLMIAISANSVYDYELAMSTFEMRRAMIESIIDILGIKNVSFLKENVKIEGSLGTYVVNIRTGLTFKEGKGNLLIKTIDNYDKPIALDFIDEDPMTADIVTKVLLLSDDKTIKDPAILKEIYD